jgi:hypothetical protein
MGTVIVAVIPLLLQLIVSSSLMLRFRRAPENVGLLVLAQRKLYIVGPF